MVLHVILRWGVRKARHQKVDINTTSLTKFSPFLVSAVTS
jgi:hypothetical protein